MRKSQDTFIKPIIFLILISTIFLSCEIKNNQKEDTAKEEKILRERMNAFNQAFKESDVEKLESMITDRYLHTNGNSKSIDKSTWVSYLRKRSKEMEAGNLIVDTYEMKETEIQMYKDMAIITAKIITSSIQNGEPQENEFRVTNIWVQEEGNWKRAGFHDGKIK